LPDDLYQELKRVANQQEWSFAETVRRGAEYIVRVYPSGQSKPNDWRLPPGPGCLRGEHSDPGAFSGSCFFGILEAQS
jgi:hypothetical protein